MYHVLTSLLMSLICSVASAADWAQWRGPGRDCHVDDAPWPDSLEGLRRTWQVPMGPSYSGPLVVGDRVIVTETRDESHEVVRALDRGTGEEIWKVEWPGSTSVPFFARENGSWIRSTPASDGQNLYVAGIRDVLVCLRMRDGQEVWRLDLADKFNAARAGFGTVCSPLIDGDHVYIQAAGAIVKLNKHDGAVVWRSEPESGGLFGAGMGASPFSSPVIATISGQRQVLVQSRKSLSGVDTDIGRRLWSIDVEAFRGMNILTPLVIDDTIFTSTYGGGTFLYEVTASGNQYSVSERWKTNKQGYMSSPVLIDGHVYLHLRNQRFTCVDPQSGETKWTTRPFGKYWSMVVNGDRILSLDQDGMLHLIAASDGKFEPLASRRISEQETWGHLAVSDQQLFIRELNAISGWNLE